MEQVKGQSELCLQEQFFVVSAEQLKEQLQIIFVGTVWCKSGANKGTVAKFFEVTVCCDTVSWAWKKGQLKIIFEINV